MRNLSTCAFVMVARSIRSAPAQNEPTVEERTMSTRVLDESVREVKTDARTDVGEWTHFLSNCTESRHSCSSYSKPYESRDLIA